MEKPQVIFLAYYYPPHREIGSLRPFRLRKYLERMGYCCHIISASPQCEPAAGITVIPDPLGSLWEGETVGHRSFAWYLELLLRHLMFPGHIGLLWSRAAAAECRRVVAATPGGRFVVFSTYPPLGSLLGGLFACGRRIPWICDFRDPLAGLIHGDTTWYQRFWHLLLEKRVFRKASAIIANTEPAAEIWRGRYPWAEHKLHVIYNGYDPEQLPRPRPIPARDYKLIVHAGTIYRGRNPNVVIEGLARLRSLGLSEAMKAKVLLVGSTLKVTEANWPLYERAQREHWLELRGTVPRAEAEAIMQAADVLLLIQPHTTVQVPAKLFEYVCIGRPILAIIPRSSPIETILVNAAVPNACLCPDDPPELSDRKLLELLRLPNTPTPINDWFCGHFNGEIQTQAVAKIIDAASRRE